MSTDAPDSELRAALLAASISDWDLAACDSGEGVMIEIPLDRAVQVVSEYLAARTSPPHGLSTDPKDSR